MQNTRTSLAIEWHHHNNTLDTFFVNTPNQDKFLFITAGDYRYQEIGPSRTKRQLGLHHLKENIGNTPMKLDDLELLANGHFLCKDSIVQPPNILSTAFSMTWWSMVVDSLDNPNKVTMRGPRKETRTFNIGAWRNFSGVTLPTLIYVAGDNSINNNYSGQIWIRSVYPIQALKSDPVMEKTDYKKSKIQNLFRKVPANREREIPLILKLNQELLRE